jgi:hypothetical protein
MSGSSPIAPKAPPRMVRLRTAIIAAVVMLFVGVGIGLTPTTKSTASPNDVTAGSGAPSLSALTPTASPSAEDASVTPSLAPTPSPIAEQPTVALPKPIVVKGSGSEKTRPFNMPDGDFTVVIAGSGDGNVAVYLIPRGGSTFDGELLFNEISHGKYRYDTVVYGVTSGSYYLDATVDGSWTVTFTPLP